MFYLDYILHSRPRHLIIINREVGGLRVVDGGVQWSGDCPWGASRGRDLGYVFNVATVYRVGSAKAMSVYRNALSG